MRAAGWLSPHKPRVSRFRRSYVRCSFLGIANPSSGCEFIQRTLTAIVANSKIPSFAISSTNMDYRSVVIEKPQERTETQRCFYSIGPGRLGLAATA